MYEPARERSQHQVEIRASKDSLEIANTCELAVAFNVPAF
jgi:hypothetical protein